MGEISERLGELDAKAGNRRDLPLRRPQRPGGGVSRGPGFRSVFNLAGGILAWSRDCGP